MKNKVPMQLEGIDGNTFSIMGSFKREAKKSGWTKEEIDEVLNEATSGDYNHLLTTIMEHIQG